MKFKIPELVSKPPNEPISPQRRQDAKKTCLISLGSSLSLTFAPLRLSGKEVLKWLLALFLSLFLLPHSLFAKKASTASDDSTIADDSTPTPQPSPTPGDSAPTPPHLREKLTNNTILVHKPMPNPAWGRVISYHQEQSQSPTDKSRETLHEFVFQDDTGLIRTAIFHENANGDGYWEVWVWDQ
jgi:hypothetical protein